MDKLNFSERCFGACPILHKAVCGSIARQAVELEYPTGDPTPVDLAGVDQAIADAFVTDGGRVFRRDCDGPSVREEGGEMVIGGPSFNTVKVTYCGRHLIRLSEADFAEPLGN